MISRMSHATIWCRDQDEALTFYRDVLGFAVRTDQSLGDFRWLTVSPPDQPELEMVLMPIGGGGPMDDETAETLGELVAKGALGPGVLATDDCRATHAELAGEGVRFLQEPEEQPYGIEAVFTDPSGNWWSLTQRHS
ncbi:VOC family protein [Euzebya sp.]|uniref:VOC family protein n=1 Tax=Euzebya sp. TaxID=1971409 RepID=UPI0035188155